jgi:HlyD family secretion protein
MNRLAIIIAVVAVLLIGGAFVAFNQFARNQEETTPSAAIQTDAPTSTPATTSSITNTVNQARQTTGLVVVDARVVPAENVTLRFGTDGQVAEIMVEEGEQVQQGDVLARLDTTDLQLRVNEAELARDAARLSIEDAQIAASDAESTYEEQIQRARDQLNRAETDLRLTQGNVTEKDLAAARADLEEARTVLQRLESGPDPEDVALARNNIEDARTNLQVQRDTLSRAKLNAEAQMQQAANRLRDVQAEYSRIYWDNQNNSNLQQADKDREAAALRTVENAEYNLEQAELAYELAQEVERAGIETAENQLAAAQIDLQELLEGATEDALAAARARVARAENNLDRLTGQQRALELEAARVNVEQARTSLDLLSPSYEATSENLSQRAEFALRQAELALEQAEIDLARATLRSPMDGTVARIDFKVNESSLERSIILADFSQWQLVTEGLIELDIMRIREGDQATITFDALPDLELPGRVSHISTFGENTNGEITYNVIITPEDWDERLRWNMTASVIIEPQTD